MRNVIAAIVMIAAVGASALLATEQPPAAGPKDATLWWPHFLGPQRNGTAPDKGLNWDWKKTPPKILWKVELGSGFSSFAIVGDRAYTMCNRGQRDIIVCLDTKNGKELWIHDAAPTYLDKQEQGAGPRSTPTYHDGKLYCVLPMGELICVSAADGKRLWAANQFTDTGAANPAGEYYYWGVSASPLVEGDLVIVQPGGKDKNSVAAYHKDTGKLVWTAGDDPLCYASPQAVTVGGQRLLIVPTGTSILGLEPIKGKILWRYAFGDSFNCASPVWVDGLLWMSATFGGGGVVLDVSVKGDQWTVKEVWKNKLLQTHYTNAMIVDGYIYGCHGDTSNILKCVDLKTGKVKWDQGMEERQWPLAVDGHLLLWSDSGSLKAVELQPKQYVEKGELEELLEVQCWAAPALADGRLYLRDLEYAICIDLRKR